MASPGDPTTTIPGSGVSVVWLDIAVPRRKAIPRAVRHTVTVSVPPGLPVPATITSTGATARVDRRAPVVLGRPLRGAGWAAVAHLRPGSLRVERGDRVRRGQAIARLGNSGSSTGPHLHFQVMNRPSAVAADGLPFVFDRFRLSGRIPALDDALVQTLTAGEPVPLGPMGRGPNRRRLPLGRDVLSFPHAE